MALSFSPESAKTLETLRSRYPSAQAAVIPALQLAQREFGYLNPEVMDLVARHLDVPATLVLSTATFYTMLHKKPVGRYHIQVCTNLACWLRGSDDVLEHLQRRLGIRVGETTPDKIFTLDEVQCLAACGTAPAMQINDDYHEDLTVEKVDRIIEALRREAGAARVEHDAPSA